MAVIMLVEDWPLERILPYAGNPRKRSKKSIDKIAASIREFGPRQPIVVDEAGVILVGHGRRDAAAQLAMAMFPVHQALGLSQAQKTAYRIADNRTNEETEWDDEKLRLEFGSLGELDLTLTGFDLRQVTTYLRGGPQAGEDDVPVDVEPRTKPGDLFLLGEHRLLCGDCTVAENVARVLDGVKPLLMVTDPPYGVGYDPEWRLKSGLNKPWQTRAEGTVTNDNQSDWSEAWKLFPGDVAYVWNSALHSSEVARGLAEAEFFVRAQIVWVKDSIVIGRGAYHWQHEPCWYAVRKGKPANWLGDRKQSTVWQLPNMHRTQGSVDDGKTEHSTQKPVEVMRRPVLNHTAKFDAVYDPFLGSGTTLIACETEGRRCYGIEIEPRYCDVIVARWEKFTGKTAQLEKAVAA